MVIALGSLQAKLGIVVPNSLPAMQEAFAMELLSRLGSCGMFHCKSEVARGKRVQRVNIPMQFMGDLGKYQNMVLIGVPHSGALLECKLRRGTKPLHVTVPTETLIDGNNCLLLYGTVKNYISTAIFPQKITRTELDTLIDNETYSRWYFPIDSGGEVIGLASKAHDITVPSRESRFVAGRLDGVIEINEHAVSYLGIKPGNLCDVAIYADDRTDHNLVYSGVLEVIAYVMKAGTQSTRFRFTALENSMAVGNIAWDIPSVVLIRKLPYEMNCLNVSYALRKLDEFTNIMTPTFTLPPEKNSPPEQ